MQRITDPEILERRYPVILREFSYRPDSGGKGKYSGGNGVIRDMQFLEPIQISLLTERRSRAPYGLAGGEPARMGTNTWIKQTTGGQTRKVNLGGKASVHLAAGDRLVLNTPGGGGWGTPTSEVNGHGDSGYKPQWEARGSLAEKSMAEAAFGA